MPRYAKQIGKRTCGPTAVANVLKWSGAQFNYRQHRKTLMWDCSIPHGLWGTSGRTLDLVLRHYADEVGFSVKFDKKPRLASIDKQLDSGGIVLVNYEHRQGKHYALIVAKTENNYYEVVNAFKDEPAQVTIDRQELKRDILYYRTSTYPVKAWMINQD